MMKALQLAIVSAISCFCIGRALAVEHVLFEIPIEMNGNNTADRAMIVIVGDDVKIEEAKPLDFYQLVQGQSADLLVFLDAGDDALNLTDMPTIRKQGLAVSDGLAFVMPPETNGKGSLNVITSNGFGNTFNTTETLTVVFRNEQFIVAGLAIDVYARGEDAHCSINFLSGNALKRRFEDKGNVPIKGNFKQALALADWTEETRPESCNTIAD